MTLKMNYLDVKQRWGVADGEELVEIQKAKNK